MKRYVLLTVGLVVVDQLLGWLAYSALPNGAWLDYGLLHIGRADHAAPLAHFLPLNLLAVGCAFGFAAILKLQGANIKWFALPIALMASAAVTQTIDMLARGTAVNYVGLGLVSAGYWTIKLTDAAYELGIALTLVLLCGGIIQVVQRELRHGKQRYSH